MARSHRCPIAQLQPVVASECQARRIENRRKKAGGHLPPCHGRKAGVSASSMISSWPADPDHGVLQVAPASRRCDSRSG